MFKTGLVTHPMYKKHDTRAHIENWRRLEVIENAILQRGILRHLIKIPPRLATIEEVLLVHTPEYIDILENAWKDGNIYLDSDTIISEDSFNVALMAVGGALNAVDEIVNANVDNVFVLSRPPGHHALSNRAMGFCLLNQVAIASRYAQRDWNLKQILIIDWDLHHGNGTESIFYEDNTVFYLSLHQYPMYPGTGNRANRGLGKGEGFTKNIPIAAYTSADQYRSLFEQALREVVGSFKPELIIISAGFDAHTQDNIGQLLLEDEDFAWMTGLVMKVARSVKSRGIISILEGGYDLPSLGNTVATHIETLLYGGSQLMPKARIIQSLNEVEANSNND